MFKMRAPPEIKKFKIEMIVTPIPKNRSNTLTPERIALAELDLETPETEKEVIDALRFTYDFLSAVTFSRQYGLTYPALELLYHFHELQGAFYGQNALFSALRKRRDELIKAKNPLAPVYKFLNTHQDSKRKYPINETLEELMKAGIIIKEHLKSKAFAINPDIYKEYPEQMLFISIHKFLYGGSLQPPPLIKKIEENIKKQFNMLTHR